jgi:hypothetical protein
MAAAGVTGAAAAPGGLAVSAVIRCVELAVGVYQFSWCDGDGVLVDVLAAGGAWIAAADVLLWSTPVPPAIARAALAATAAVLAVVPVESGEWLIYGRDSRRAARCCPESWWDAVADAYRRAVSVSRPAVEAAGPDVIA